MIAATEQIAPWQDNFFTTNCTVTTKIVMVNSTWKLSHGMTPTLQVVAINIETILQTFNVSEWGRI